MHIQPKKLASGIRYYIRYWKDKKNCCIPVHIIRNDVALKGEYPFKTMEEAQQYIQASNALEDFKSHAEGLRFLNEKRKYGDFTHRFRNLFIEDSKEKAPRSYETQIYYLDKFVYPFFLDVVNEFNVNKWHLHFREYRNWLRDSAFKKGVGEKRETISYSTKNHCIRALNRFIKSLASINVVTPDANIKCESFERSLVDRNARGVDDIISIQEYNLLKMKLSRLPKEFFICMYNTGMRFNELYSISVNDIYFQEHVEDGLDEWMRLALAEHGYKIYGYIRLNSQVEDMARNYNSNKEVPRVPLKGRKKISSRDGRNIPITDAETMNILIKRYNFALKFYGDNPKESNNDSDWFLFCEDHNEIRRHFRKHCQKGFHACRHSYTTNLIGKTRHQILTRTITGHRSMDVFERYVHIYEEYMNKSNIPKTRTQRDFIIVEDDDEKIA
ncbi:hypothetical protein ABMA67_02550 [Halobacteriovorax sp. RZ-3]|uniref:hypothetical protein n=1 Tax=Halobacteriovorax sp. RZ-3 TaxID=3157720 RepID=UPI003719B6FD